MKKSIENSIITVDNYNDTYFKYAKGKFFQLSSLRRSKSDVLITYISNSDLIIEPIDLSPNLPKDSIQDVITDKVYDELRLDMAIEYQVYPVKTAISSDLVKYQAIIADKNAVKEKFLDLQKKVKYIDYLIPAPLLYKSLFAEKYLGSVASYVFIHFGDKDTFVTFYHKGEFLYSKSVKFSLENMYDRFCQLAQEVPFTLDKFKTLLANDGLRDSSNSYKELIIRVINECFLTINDVIIYTKRAYEIDSFKELYVSFDWGYIDGIELYVQNYLNLKSKPLVSLYSKEDPKVAITPIHTLMRMSAQQLNSGSLDIVNLTPYPKPKPITKRPAGKLMLGFISIIFLSSTPIIYDYVIGTGFKAQNTLLSTKERKLTNEANSYKAKIKDREDKKKALDSAIDKVSKVYRKKKGELTNVYNKKFKYQFKSEQLVFITNILKDYDIKSRNIKTDGNLYSIEIESTDEKQLTSFVKKLVKKFSKEITNIHIENIKYDEKEHLYKGVLNVEFRGEM